MEEIEVWIDGRRKMRRISHYESVEVVLHRGGPGIPVPILPLRPVPELNDGEAIVRTMDGQIFIYYVRK